MAAGKVSAARKANAKLPVALDDIAAAQTRLRGAIVETDCDFSCTLSSIVGCKVWLKFENLQFTASFKERGALNRLAALTPAERRRGVIAMSAGNHGQGVAYHAHRMAIPATIVMPVNTPTVKVTNTRGHGAEVILFGETVEEAAQFARAHGDAKGLTFIHPYDDPLVIAGQGTIALEMLGAAPEIDTLIVPIGGGGLISGVAIAAKTVRPDMRVIGVQSALYPSMYNATRGARLAIEGDTLAEGIAVKDPGKLTTPIVEQLVDDIVLVGEPEIEHAVSLLLNIEKTVVEGAGAVGLAAALQLPQAFAGRAVGLVLSGGNIDTRLLASVLTRELAREGRLAQLCIDLVDRPGALAKVANVLAGAGANIVEVAHQRVFSDLPAKHAMLDLVIETRDRRHLEDAVESLKQAGFAVALGNSAAGRR
jgi:threonine dehydratase